MRPERSQFTRRSRLSWVIALILLVVVQRPAFSQVGCVAVNGMVFERVDQFKLLASKDGKNVAIVHTVQDVFNPLPTSLGAFRFFSDKLCQSGAESQFHIGGRLYQVTLVQVFRQ